MRWRRCMGLLVLLAAGCGLDEYEKKMREQQQVLEREKKLDSKPLDLPEAKQRGVYVFLRPPKEGIPSSPQQKGDDWIYAYSKESPYGIYLAWPREVKPASKEKQADKEKDKHADKEKDKQPEKPKEKQNLKEVVAWALKGRILPDSKAPSPPESLRGGVRLPVEKSARLQGRDAADKVWTGYLYLDELERVAIVYVVSGEEASPETLEKIKASLSTLALGEEARKARDEYSKRQPGRP